MAEFQEKQILIIGGTSGFGKELAKNLLLAGAEVTVTGRNFFRLEQVIEELATYGDVSGVAFTANSEESIQHFFSELGHYHHIVSFVGGAMAGGFLTAPLAEINQVVHDKFTLNLLLARVGQSYLLAGGSLVMTAGAGDRADLASGAIVGNKALEQLVHGLALELAPTLRVNAVAPTWTDTGLWSNLTKEQRQNQIISQRKTIPLQQESTVKEVVKAYLFLLDCNFITGQTITVDGGATLL